MNNALVCYSFCSSSKKQTCCLFKWWSRHFCPKHSFYVQMINDIQFSQQLQTKYSWKNYKLIVINGFWLRFFIDMNSHICEIEHFLFLHFDWRCNNSKRGHLLPLTFSSQIWMEAIYTFYLSLYLFLSLSFFFDLHHERKFYFQHKNVIFLNRTSNDTEVQWNQVKWIGIWLGFFFSVDSIEIWQQI